MKTIGAKKRLEDVQLVQDFPKVFPPETAGVLPPTRQLEFKLIWGTGAAPVARRLSISAFRKRKEFLSNERAIGLKAFKTSSSPLGAPVFSCSWLDISKIYGRVFQDRQNRYDQAHPVGNVRKRRTFTHTATPQRRVWALLFDAERKSDFLCIRQLKIP
ncbi:hypothetical protein Tco_0360946 [Tanacetum coccineum]